MEAVHFDKVLAHFRLHHPHHPGDKADSNDEAEVHIRNAQAHMEGVWHEVLLEGPEVRGVMLPWHLGEDGEVELIPKTGLTVQAAAARLAALGDTYTTSNPLCAHKLARQAGAEPTAVFLTTRAVGGPDYEGLSVQEGLIHLDGLHRMLAWERARSLSPGQWLRAYVAGLRDVP